MLRKQFRISLFVFVLMTLITGVAYPLLVTGIAQLLFPFQANGSIITSGGAPVGSALIGQTFAHPKYFFGRPSATLPAYNGGASGGSNLGPLNPAYLDGVRERVRALRAHDAGDPRPVPVDLVTASGSGLDPHISVASAMYQVPGIAKERGLPEDSVRSIVLRHRRGRRLGFFGGETVNVLMLNLALDEIGREAEDR